MNPWKKEIPQTCALRVKNEVRWLGFLGIILFLKRRGNYIGFCCVHLLYEYPSVNIDTWHRLLMSLLINNPISTFFHNMTKLSMWNIGSYSIMVAWHYLNDLYFYWCIFLVEISEILPIRLDHGFYRFNPSDLILASNLNRQKNCYKQSS